MLGASSTVLSGGIVDDFHEVALGCTVGDGETPIITVAWSLPPSPCLLVP